MVRCMTITGCLTLLLVSVLAEARAWYPPQGQVGWASWYGARHHGRQTASGERFSMHALTAAHRSLPLGTPVRVTHLATGQQVHVTINDRGPFVDQQRRIIDLSRAAAERIGLLRHGVGRVRIEVLEEPGTRQDRRTTMVARSSLVQPRPTGLESASNASRWALAERRKAERSAGAPAGERVTPQRTPSHVGPVTPSSLSWPDCRVAVAQCLVGD
jgi:peptidoglycan lytic transglycosylase